MIRRSGNKIYTKVTQYFTDDSSAVGYSHNLTTPTESFCGTNFYYEQRYTSSLTNGKWRDCLYGPFTFCSGSTSASACTSGNCDQFYLDTSTIVIDYTGIEGDHASTITLYTGSRLYLSSSLELAPDGYYVSGGIYYKVGNGNCCGWNDGTFMSSGSCSSIPTGSTAVTASVTGVGGFMQPCVGGTIDDNMGASIGISNPVDVDTTFVVNVSYYTNYAGCNNASSYAFTLTIPSGSSSDNFNACTNGYYISTGATICSACVSSCDNPNITFGTSGC